MDLSLRGRLFWLALSACTPTEIAGESPTSERSTDAAPAARRTEASRVTVVRAAGIAFDVPPSWTVTAEVDYAVADAPRYLTSCAARRIRTAFPPPPDVRDGQTREMRQRIVDLMIGNETTTSAVWCTFPTADTRASAIVDAVLASVRADPSTRAWAAPASDTEHVDICTSEAAVPVPLVFVLDRAGKVRSGAIADGTVLRPLALPAAVRELRCSSRFALLRLVDDRVFTATKAPRDLGVSARALTDGGGIGADGFLLFDVDGVTLDGPGRLSPKQLAKARALAGDRDNGCLVDATGNLICWADEMFGDPLVEPRGRARYSPNDHAASEFYVPERIVRLVEEPARLRGLRLHGGRVCAHVGQRWLCVGEGYVVDEYPDCSARACVCRPLLGWRCDDTAPVPSEWPKVRPSLSDVVAYSGNCALTSDGRVHCLRDGDGISVLTVE